MIAAALAGECLKGVAAVVQDRDLETHCAS